MYIKTLKNIQTSPEPAPEPESMDSKTRGVVLDSETFAGVELKFAGAICSVTMASFNACEEGGGEGGECFNVALVPSM